METINFQMLASLANAARACGINLNQVLQELGIDIDMTADPRKRMSLRWFSVLFQAIADKQPKQYFPLVLGHAFNFDGLPELATFVTSASTPRDAIKVFDWAPQLLHPALSFSTEEGPVYARLNILVQEGNGEFNDLPGFVESVAAAVLKFMRLISPMSTPLLSVEFKHSAQTAPDEYAQFFETPVRFDQAANCMVFDTNSLSQPLPGGIPSAHNKAEELIVNRLLKVSEPGVLSSRITRLLRSKVSLLSLPMEKIAMEMDMHPRKMQRQLQEEGTTYAHVLASVRMNMACEMLQKSVLDIETISSRLGYSDRRSFTHAFASWTGKTPREFRLAPSLKNSS